MEAVPANCLRDVRPLALQACVIGIDEGQFVSFLRLYFQFFSAHIWPLLTMETGVSLCSLVRDGNSVG